MDEVGFTTSRNTTRDRLIEAARLLFWEKGYEPTSLAEVVQKAGAKTGSLYYFFRTKEQLLLAVLDKYVEMLWPAVIEPVFNHVTDPIERIFGILDGYRRGLEHTGFAGGCPIGNLALEVSDELPRAREKIAQNFAGWRGWIRKCLEDAAERLPMDLNREQLAIFVLTVMEGAVMQTRAHKSLEPFDASVNQLRDYFNRLLAEGAERQVPRVQ